MDMICIKTASIGGAEIQTVNARELHAFLEVGKDFSTWIKDRIAAYDFTENNDFVVFPEIGENPSGGRPTREYAITLDMAKELAMVERNERGKQARAYFIECERRAKEAKPLNPASLTRLDLIRIAMEAEQERLLLETRVEEMRPKVEAHDRIAESFGSVCRKIAAKNLNVPPQVLNRWMATHGWTYKHANGDTLAYQSKISAGYLEHKISTGERPDGTMWTGTNVHVTPKGMLALAKELSPPAMRT